MPTYQYRCTSCGHDLEAVQKFSDAALTECPNCGGPLRKVFNAVGVVFKGSGFYRTDSRKVHADSGSVDGSGDRKNGTGAGEKKAGENGSGGDGGKKEPVPANAGSIRNGSTRDGSSSNGSSSNGSTRNGSTRNGSSSNGSSAGGSRGSGAPSSTGEKSRST
jgi:putative FmdB family regulatory protein